MSMSIQKNLSAIHDVFGAGIEYLALVAVWMLTVLVVIAVTVAVAYGTAVMWTAA